MQFQMEIFPDTSEQPWFFQLHGYVPRASNPGADSALGHAKEQAIPERVLSMGFLHVGYLECVSAAILCSSRGPTHVGAYRPPPYRCAGRTALTSGLPLILRTVFLQYLPTLEALAFEAVLGSVGRHVAFHQIPVK